MNKENKDIVTLEFDEHGMNHEIGDTYLGEVNENGEPHGRGVLKSKDNFVTTNGWWKNGLLHGEATISKGYNKENEDETRKEKRTGNFLDGLMHGTHIYEAFRRGKFRKIIQVFEHDIVVYDTNEDGTHDFYLNELHHYDYLFSKNINLKNVREIGFGTEEVIKNIDAINQQLNKFSDLELVFYDWSNWRKHKDKILSLLNADNLNAKNFPNTFLIRFEEMAIEKKEDISSINEIVKYFIIQIYRSFALSNMKNFKDYFEEFSMNVYDYSHVEYFPPYDFGNQNDWGYDELEKMKSLSEEEHNKLCDEGLKNYKGHKNYNMHEMMVVDNEYDILFNIKIKN